MAEDHSLDHGHQQDILTGKPIEPDDSIPPSRAEKLSGLRQRQIEAESVVQELQSPEGWRTIEVIHQALDERVDELVKDDDQCQAYIKLLNSFGAKVATGRQIAKRIALLENAVKNS